MVNSHHFVGSPEVLLKCQDGGFSVGHTLPVTCRPFGVLQSVIFVLTSSRKQQIGI